MSDDYTRTDWSGTRDYAGDPRVAETRLKFSDILGGPPFR